MGAKVKVPVLCPAWVKTQIMEAEQHRPAELQNDSHTEFTKQGGPAYQQIVNSVRNGIQSGISCEQVADCVLGAIKVIYPYLITASLYIIPITL